MEDWVVGGLRGGRSLSVLGSRDWVFIDVYGRVMPTDSFSNGSFVLALPVVRVQLGTQSVPCGLSLQSSSTRYL
ncbi:hypothetical protein GCM10023159_05270 [Brevibacterium yomogidense]